MYAMVECKREYVRASLSFINERNSISANEAFLFGAFGINFSLPHIFFGYFFSGFFYDMLGAISYLYQAKRMINEMYTWIVIAKVCGGLSMDFNRDK